MSDKVAAALHGAVAVPVGVFETGSPEWHAARAGKMTGSKIAAVMGISPYESHFSLWHREQGLVGDVTVSEPMEWGNRLEGAVLAKYAEMHPEVVFDSKATWQNIERPWQVANPDGVFRTPEGERHLLEVKTARYDDGWKAPATDGIPVHYRAQVLWYLDTLGLTTAHIAVLIGGSEYREYRIDLDDAGRADILLMREAAQAFLVSIETGTVPDIDTHAATYETVKQLHPDVEAITVQISRRAARLAYQAKKFGDKAEALMLKARSVLAAEMGSAHYAEFGTKRIADRRAKKAAGSIPYVQLGRELPNPDERSAA